MPQDRDTESRDLHALALQFLPAASRSHVKPKACANKRQEDFLPSFPPARLLKNVITLLSGCFLRQGWCSLFPPLGLANSHTSFSMDKTSLKPAGQPLAVSFFFFSAATKSKEHAGEGEGPHLKPRGPSSLLSAKSIRLGFSPASDFLCRKWLFVASTLSFNALILLPWASERRKASSFPTQKTF